MSPKPLKFEVIAQEMVISVFNEKLKYLRASRHSQANYTDNKSFLMK